MKIHAVDGTYELFRSFFGAPSASSPAGQEVGATRGFLRSMLAMLRSGDVSHIGAAFDTVIESFRNDMFDGYKTGEGIEPTLHQQFPLVEEAAEALGMAVWRMKKFEADDALASVAAVLGEDSRVDQVLLCSPDKDLAQCVRGDRVVCIDRLRDRMLDEDGVRAKFGVDPASIPDYLGLVGDSADGIPGLPRWGAKSTATVLSRYGHVEDIPDDESTWDIKVRGAAGLAKSLREHRKEAALYRDLAVLRRDALADQPGGESPDALLETMEWRGAYRDKLEDLCERIGERTLIDRVPRWRE